MSKNKQPPNPAAALVAIRWANATEADKQAAAEAMAAGRRKIPKKKRLATARKANKASWSKAARKKRKQNAALRKKAKKSSP